MIFILKRPIFLCVRLLALVVFFYNGFLFAKETQGSELTLHEAERLAICQSPEIQSFYAQSQSLAEKSIAEAQLPDPKFVAGIINLPTNTFSFTQDDMTMISLGVQQVFPPGQALAYKSQQTKALSDMQFEKIEEQKLAILRNVRQAWLELYYWIHAINILKENQATYMQLLDATYKQYSRNKAALSDVLQVQLELSRLQDQITQANQQQKIARAQLRRWIGKEAKRPLAGFISHWNDPPPLKILKKNIKNHPILTADEANIDASEYDVAGAREQFKPGWMLDLSYGIRQGQSSDGTERANMVTANATIDLPIFTKDRQKRQLKASAYQLEAAKYDRVTHYKDLLQDLNVRYATWESLGERELIYKNQLSEQAKQNSKAALLVYRNMSENLTTLIRAYSSELAIKLENLQVKLEREKARVALLYYEGLVG